MRREIRRRRERRSRRNSWIIFFTVLIVVLGIVTFFVYSFSSSDNDNGAKAPLKRPHEIRRLVLMASLPQTLLRKFLTRRLPGQLHGRQPPG